MLSADTGPRSCFSDPRPSAHVPLPRHVSAPRLARTALRSLLASRGWPPAQDAELVISELVANAVEHGAGPITLTLWLTEGRIRGEVADAGTGAPPAPVESSEDSERGRGLTLVDALSERWGAAETASRVWFETAQPGGDDDG